MTSLKIVNEALQQIKDSGECYIEDFELEKIKQCLEVLLIIVNKEVNMGELRYYIERYSDEEIDYILEQYNSSFSKFYQLTLEELIKLKQYLDVNKDGDSNE